MASPRTMIADGNSNAATPCSDGRHEKVSNWLSERSCQMTFVELVPKSTPTIKVRSPDGDGGRADPAGVLGIGEDGEASLARATLAHRGAVPGNGGAGATWAGGADAGGAGCAGRVLTVDGVEGRFGCAGTAAGSVPPSSMDHKRLSRRFIRDQPS